MGQIAASIVTQQVDEFIGDMQALGNVERFFGVATASSPYLHTMRPQDFNFQWNDEKGRFALGTLWNAVFHLHNLFLLDQAQYAAVVLSETIAGDDRPCFEYRGIAAA